MQIDSYDKKYKLAELGIGETFMVFDNLYLKVGPTGNVWNFTDNRLESMPLSQPVKRVECKITMIT